jgi:hypothetical protein
MLRIALMTRAPMRQLVFVRRRSHFLTIAVIGLFAHRPGARLDVPHDDHRGIRLKLALSLVILAMLIALPAEALEWRWSYQGEGVTASGAFTTKDAPNADGFYEITVIKGEMNGVAITALQAAGTSIPGNDGYPVDGLVRTEGPQLSLHGFGYALADGTYANPFYGDRFVPPGVYAFFSDPKNRKTSEPLVKFTATKAP